METTPMKMFCHSMYFATNPTKSAKMIDDFGPAAGDKHGLGMTAKYDPFDGAAGQQPRIA